MQVKVLIVDDERNIADALAYGFIREGFSVETAYDGLEALEKINEFQPDLLVMDVMMPKLNGYEVCKQIDLDYDMGIILLTAKGDISDKVLGLESGADDYITKPFDIREVIARSKALVRRLKKSTKRNQKVDCLIGGLELHCAKRKVIVDQVALELTPKEYELISTLLLNLEIVYSREQLLDIVWGMSYEGGTRTVDIHVQRLRKKLGTKYQNVIQTVFGVGYKATGENYEN